MLTSIPRYTMSGSEGEKRIAAASPERIGRSSHLRSGCSARETVAWGQVSADRGGIPAWMSVAGSTVGLGFGSRFRFCRFSKSSVGVESDGDRVGVGRDGNWAGLSTEGVTVDIGAEGVTVAVGADVGAQAGSVSEPLEHATVNSNVTVSNTI